MRAALTLCLVALLAGPLPVRAEKAPGEQELLQAVDHYFVVWSKADMKAYEACFHPQGVVTFVDETGQLRHQAVKPFVEGQREAHRRATVPMKEIPLKVETSLHGRYANALVYWELKRGSDVSTGVNLFSYVAVDGRWVIASLVFGPEP